MPDADKPRKIRTKITFQREKFVDLLLEIGPLFRLHDAEIWPDRTWGMLKPDIVRYLTMEQGGILHVLAARTGGGRLIGYNIEIVTRSLHYDLIEGLSDTVYLLPAYRTGKGLSIRKSPGFRLLQARERMLDEMKVVRRRISTKVWLNFGPLLELLGYKPEATIYLKTETF